MKVRCKDCKGTGLTLPLCDSECASCGGSGQVEQTYEKKPATSLPDTEDGELIRKLLDVETMSDWETDFTISVEKQVLAGRSLSAKQKHIIERITGGY